MTLRQITRHITLLTFVLFTLWIAVPSASAQTAESVDWGTVTYPLDGNLRTEQGTLRVRFLLNEDVSRPPGPDNWQQPRDNWCRYMIARVVPNKTHHLNLFGRKAAGRIWTGMEFPGYTGHKPNLRAERVGPGWAAGSVHTIGYTWTEEGTHALWVDGKRRMRLQNVGRPGEGLGPVNVKTGRLVLGGPGRRSSAITILAVHVIDAPLPDEAMQETSEKGFRPLSIREPPYSLLLDRFEGNSFTPNGERQTDAAVVSGFSGERGGTPSAACRFVRTEYGPGIRLYTLSR